MRWLVPIEVMVIVEADSKEEALYKTVMRAHLEYDDVKANLCTVMATDIKKTTRRRKFWQAGEGE